MTKDKLNERDVIQTDDVSEEEPIARASRGTRRKQDFRKSARKRRIAEEIGFAHPGQNQELHRYSKGKIHCSCPLCAAKVNDAAHRGGRGKNWSVSDRRKIDAMEAQEHDSEAPACV